MDELREKIEGLGEQARQKARRYLDYYSEVLEWEKRAEEDGKLELREHFRNAAAAHLNDYYYWMGQARMAKGIAAGMGLQGIVEGEIDGTPSCP